MQPHAHSQLLPGWPGLGAEAALRFHGGKHGVGRPAECGKAGISGRINDLAVVCSSRRTDNLALPHEHRFVPIRVSLKQSGRSFDV